MPRCFSDGTQSTLDTRQSNGARNDVRGLLYYDEHVSAVP